MLNNLLFLNMYAPKMRISGVNRSRRWLCDILINAKMLDIYSISLEIIDIGRCSLALYCTFFFFYKDSFYDVIIEIGTVFSQEKSKMASKMTTKMPDIAYIWKQMFTIPI